MKTSSKQLKHCDLHLKVTTVHRETNDNTLIVIVSTMMNNYTLFLDKILKPGLCRKGKYHGEI